MCGLIGMYPAFMYILASPERKRKPDRSATLGMYLIWGEYEYITIFSQLFLVFRDWGNLYCTIRSPLYRMQLNPYRSEDQKLRILHALKTGFDDHL
jgi:hypothetical protein